MHSLMRSLLLVLFSIAWSCCAAAPEPAAVVLNVDGAISPGTADYVVRGLQAAEEQHAQLVVLKMDTPGGLDTSMRQIIKKIIASPVPVVAYVAPNGARAASAGTYILYASHVAAMAPATNLGAATPVMIGGIGGLPQPGGQPKNGGKDEDQGKKDGANAAAEKTAAPESPMERKLVNDASAYIRSLAQMRGRNVEWAEQAVRHAVSLSATEALKLKVIDLIAPDVPSLLRQLDGRKVNVLGVERTLNTTGVRIVTLEPDWRSRLLTVIADPSLAYLLMLAGIFGIFFEFSNPGFVLPGVVGAISLFLALFAFQVLPINYAGLGLILLGIAFMAGEVFMSGSGLLGIGGITAFVIGSVMLIHTDIPGYGVSLSVIVPVTLASALFIFFVVTMVVRARNRPVVSGREEMIGAVGEMLEASKVTEGSARVKGEIWHVRSAQPLGLRQKVKVVGMDGLILDVLPQQEQKDG